MNMHWIDWSIVAGLMVVMTAIALYTEKHTRSVADFLAANRCAGRYILAVAGDMSSLGAISVLAWYEMYYNNGFGAAWWSLMLLPVSVILALSGWIVYRFRQTRAMTMAQFFEIRYSRNFRVFAGIVTFVSGVLNFGIFPAVGARFFIHFCGFPPEVMLLGMAVPTFPLVMAALLIMAIFFTFVGGQIAVIATDFLEGVLSNVVIIVVLVYLAFVFDFEQISSVLLSAEEGQSMIDPFEAGKAKDFGFVYFAILATRRVYNYMAWQGSQGYNCSATSPHEARMSRILGNWRSITRQLLFVLMPICVYAMMRHGDFAATAAEINDTVAQIDNETLKKQMLVPVATTMFLPKGLFGAMCAMMLAAFISTNDSMLHSWASIFVQDVVMPFRKKPLSPKAHMRWLRWAVVGVAVFVFLFGLVFPQRQYIFMWMAITGTIYLGGAGAVIIGGLYWKRATTAAAWVAMIIGSVLAVTGIVIRQLHPEFFLNGQEMYFVAIVICVAVYIIISLCDKTPDFDMASMLHEEEDTEDAGKGRSKRNRLFERLGITKEFTKGDITIYFASLVWTLGWFAVFIIGCVYRLFFEIPETSWLRFWTIYAGIVFASAVIFTVWYSIGGFIDMKDMFRRLRVARRSGLDDGTVVDHHNLDEGAGEG